MNKFSKILFHIGNTILLLIGLAHLAAHFSSVPLPVDENQRKFLELFSSTKFAMPSGEMRSYEEIFSAFSLYFVVFPIGMAVMLWIASGHWKTLKSLLLVASIMMFLTAFITFKYAIFPPSIMMLITAICFLVAFSLSKKRSKLDL